jgi:hypothetical protein
MSYEICFSMGSRRVLRWIIHHWRVFCVKLNKRICREEFFLLKEKFAAKDFSGKELSVGRELPAFLINLFV